MEVFEAIRVRRSVREYRPDPIPEDLLERVTEALRLAPSACNYQPWRFILVRDPRLRSEVTAACHGQAFAQLQASPAKHREIACVTCHANKHKTVPQCSDCHGLPHAEAMHKRLPKCGDCHNIAHDLNNWPAKPEGKAQPGAKK